MKNNIAVSVIVPVYNAEKYLFKCLDSIVNQTLKNIEIIIIDDGSTDGSSEICKKYASEDNRIIYYKKENEGLAAARQDGMERASGEYIGFVDSDDWIELNMYERMYEKASEESADIVFCNCFFNDSETDRIHLKPGIYDRNGIEKEILPRSLAGISPKGSNSVIRWSNCLRIYKLALIRENNISFGRNFRRSQDLQLTFETTLCAQKYISLNDEYLYHNRTVENADSLSRGYTKNYWKLIRPLIDKLYEDVENYKNQDLTNQMHLCAFFFAASVVKNEFESKVISFSDKIKKLNEIAHDEVIQAALPYIEKEKLSNYYQAIYYGLCKKNAFSVYLKYWLFIFKRDKYKQFVRKTLKNKIASAIFNMLKK